MSLADVTIPVPPRQLAAVFAGKATRRAVRMFGSGGTALPGLVAERLDADLTHRLAGELDAAALITGTNGKTTTAAMLARILREGGRGAIHNRAGSNLMRGVLTALIDAAGPSGRLPRGRTAVLETDEAALASVAQAVPPTVALFTNLMRDQLDRYGEIESIALRWAETLAHVPDSTQIIVNADDPLVASLADRWPGTSLRFGIEDPEVPPAPAGEIMDAVWDPVTQADFRYHRRYFAQLGRWYTDTGAERPTPEIAADQIAEAGNGMTFSLALPHYEPFQIVLPAEGLYSVYNALAAAAAAVALGLNADAIRRGLETHRAAFGRQEELTIEGHQVRVLLGKNPSGLNQALRTLQQPGQRHHLLVLLNDGIADGTDVSWIWDVDWESQAGHCALLTVGGRRAADIALRLEYAGLPAAQEPVRNDIGAALDQAFAALPEGEPLIVLPTYTAMLDVRQRLGRMSGSRLWEVA